MKLYLVDSQYCYSSLQKAKKRFNVLKRRIIENEEYDAILDLEEIEMVEFTKKELYLRMMNLDRSEVVESTKVLQSFQLEQAE